MILLLYCVCVSCLSYVMTKGRTIRKVMGRGDRRGLGRGGGWGRNGERQKKNSRKVRRLKTIIHAKIYVIALSGWQTIYPTGELLLRVHMQTLNNIALLRKFYLLHCFLFTLPVLISTYKQHKTSNWCYAFY